MGPGQTTLSGKAAELVVVRGGNYRAGTPREGWDHATPWMRRILEGVWGLNLTVVETDFALVGVVPAMDEFKEMAATIAHRVRPARPRPRRQARSLTSPRDRRR